MELVRIRRAYPIVRLTLDLADRDISLDSERRKRPRERIFSIFLETLAILINIIKDLINRIIIMQFNI